MIKILFYALAGLFLTACAHNSSLDHWSYLFQTNSSDQYLMKGEDNYDWTQVFQIPEDGFLRVNGKGHPIAFIQTKKSWSDFELEYEFRWPDTPGNSGVQLFSTDTAHFSIWPQCVEVQMAHGNVGAFWILGQALDARPEQIPDNPDHQSKREFLQDAEKPVGEWNSMKVSAHGNSIEVYLNGVMVNKGWNASHNSGKITIQSEESNIDYRNFRIRSL